MFQSSKTSDDVRKHLKDNNWEIGDQFPGPEAFFPKKAGVPHLHFTMKTGGQCYLHWKDAQFHAHEINSMFAILGNCPQNLKDRIWGLMEFLTT